MHTTAAAALALALALPSASARMLSAAEQDRLGAHEAPAALPCDVPIAKQEVVFPDSLLAGDTDAATSGMWAGYVNVTSEDYLHYILNEAANPTDDAPLIIWTNGGPGCSAMEGWSTEYGPLELLNIKVSKFLATGHLSPSACVDLRRACRAPATLLRPTH